MSILDDLEAIREQLGPTIWYIVTEMIPPGKSITVAKTDSFPEVHYFHPDNWAQIHRELTAKGWHLRDYRFWKPQGAAARNTIDADS